MIRALYEWILDNECTPHILVNAMAQHVEVPGQYVKNGEIVLNISPVAVMDLQLTNDAIQFNGRFGGVPMDVYVPIGAVMGIYARENGQGMVFEMEEPQPSPPGPGRGGDDKPPSGDRPAETRNKPGLRVVK